MPANYKWLPVVTDYCTGCSKCVEACPHDCLELEWDFAKLARADLCVGEGECVAACPHESMHMEWLEKVGDQEVGRWCERTVPAPSMKRRWLGGLFQR